MNPLRFAIMGTGRIAGKVAPYIASADGCEVVCCASRDVARARMFADTHTIQSVCTYAELLKNDDVDAVYVTLPNGDHPTWSEKLLEAGKHVLCEKPLCWTGAQAERLFDAAAANERVLVEAFMYLHSPLTAEAVSVARTAMITPDTSPIGKLKSVEAHFDISIESGHEPGPKSNVRYSRELMGGSLMDLGCYPLSFARTVTGESPDSLTARAHMIDQFDRSVRDGSDAVDGSVVIDGAFPSGVGFHLTCSMVEGVDAEGRPSPGSVNNGASRNLARLIGEKGTATVHHFSRPERIEIESEAGSRVIEARDADNAVVADPMGVYTLQAESFARSASAVERGERAESVPSPAWSIQQAEIIERTLREIEVRFDEPSW